MSWQEARQKQARAERSGKQTAGKAEVQLGSAKNSGKPCSGARLEPQVPLFLPAPPLSTHPAPFFSRVVIQAHGQVVTVDQVHDVGDDGVARCRLLCTNTRAALLSIP